MNYFTPQVLLLESKMKNFNPIYFEISEYIDFLSDKFDHFVITKCDHFLEVEDAGLSGEQNVYVDIMRSI